MVKTYQLALDAAAHRLSEVYPGDGTAEVAKDDIPYREISLEASGGTVYVGSDNTVSTTTFGLSLATGTRVRLGPYDQGPLKLSDLWVTGAAATVHVTAVPF